jgi:hypothetical protein
MHADSKFMTSVACIFWQGSPTAPALYAVHAQQVASTIVSWAEWQNTDRMTHCRTPHLPALPLYAAFTPSSAIVKTSRASPAQEPGAEDSAITFGDLQQLTGVFSFTHLPTATEQSKPSWLLSKFEAWLQAHGTQVRERQSDLQTLWCCCCQLNCAV